MRIAVKPNTKYLFSWLPSSTNCGAYVFLNGVNSDTTRFELRKGFGSFTTVEDTAYIMIRFDYDGTGFFKVSKIMITEKESIYLPNKVAEGVPEVADKVLAFEKTIQEVEDIKAYIGYTDEDIAGLCVDFENKTKTCFVIMPISDQPKYPTGHFDKIYEQIIVPAVKEAEFEPIRADSNQICDSIMQKILKNLIECDMAICDLSSRNPNVMYELGIRQAYGKKVVLVQDDVPEKIRAQVQEILNN